jgi:hypothetical protein
MVMVLSSGSGEEAKARREGIMSTWYEEGVYVVTREELPQGMRPLRLPLEAENITIETLPIKVNAMWAEAYRSHLADYDWFMKVRWRNARPALEIGARQGRKENGRDAWRRDAQPTRLPVYKDTHPITPRMPPQNNNHHLPHSHPHPNLRQVDDDTFVNLEQLRRTLSAFNPDLPLFVGKPFAGQTDIPIAGPTRQWHRYRAPSFCHGGAGYIFSRALLQHVGPSFVSHRHVSKNEDTTVGSIVHETLGARCLHYSGQVMGGLDLVGNSHDQAYIVQTVQAMAVASARELLAAVTVHSVNHTTARLVYDTQQRLRSPQALEAVDRSAAEELGSRAQLLVASWHCSATGGSQAVCMDLSLRERPPNTVRPLGWQPGPRSPLAWRAVEAEKGAQACVPVRLTKEASSPQAFARFDEAEGAEQRRPLKSAPKNEEAGAGSGSGGDDAANAVLVVLGSDLKRLGGATMRVSEEEELAAVALLGHSLRQVGSRARLVIFFPDALTEMDDGREGDGGSVLGQRAQRRVLEALGPSACNTQVVIYDDAALHAELEYFQGQSSHSSYDSHGQDLLAVYALVHDFMGANAFADVLLVPPDTYFQQPPFMALPLAATVGGEDGRAALQSPPGASAWQPELTLLASDPAREPDPSEVPYNCIAPPYATNEQQLTLNGEFMLGRAEAVRTVLGEVLTSMQAYRGCPADEILRAVVFSHMAARLVPLAVLAPDTAPVAQLGATDRRAHARSLSGESGEAATPGQADADVVLANAVGTAAAVVTQWMGVGVARVVWSEAPAVPEGGEGGGERIAPRPLLLLPATLAATPAVAEPPLPTLEANKQGVA